MRNPDASTIHARTEPIVFSFDGKYTEEAIRQKLIRLELVKEEQQPFFDCCCSSKLEFDLPEELPSVASYFIVSKKHFIPKASISIEDKYEVLNHTKNQT